MRAWAVQRPGPIDDHPLVSVNRPEPSPGPGEVRVAVRACGVCRTDLHLAEGDLSPRRPLITPGHEVVGIVDALGPGASRFPIGERIGIPWLRWTCGSCRFCTTGMENLCLSPRFTGWDDHGGYAPWATVPEDFAYPIPPVFSDEAAAPLLCAGIIGFRSLRAANLPRGGTLGIYGFGGSAHLTLQVALFEGATAFVFSRSGGSRRLAMDLGAHWSGDLAATPPKPLQAALVFAPAGEVVPYALRALDRGGTAAIAGIHMSDIPPLDYGKHLFQERTLRSVTANTRADGAAFLEIAARIPIRPATVAYPLDGANAALGDLARGKVSGAAVLMAGEAGPSS